MMLKEVYYATQKEIDSFYKGWADEREGKPNPYRSSLGRTATGKTCRLGTILDSEVLYVQVDDYDALLDSEVLYVQVDDYDAFTGYPV